MTYHCEACDATIEHADSLDCPVAADGFCKHLRDAGWHHATVRVHRTVDPFSDDWPGEVVVSKGGWLCPVHAARGPYAS